jgi:polyisoprenoid-binding protein YceI
MSIEGARMGRAIVVAIASLLAGAAQAQAPAVELQVDRGHSSITYTLVHKLHKVDGTSHQLEGKARLLPDGKAQVMVRVPAASFDSGNVNRDEHMKETVEAARFPTVELKALGEGVTPPASFPATVTRTFKAQLAFHGQQKLFDLPVELTWEAPDRVRAHAQFPVSLDYFKVERPSLMFVKVEDELKIDAKLVFVK